MIKVSDIYSKTHDGLDIILDYYPQAEGCVDNKKKFKRRPGRRRRFGMYQEIQSK